MTRILIILFTATSIFAQTTPHVKINSILEDIYFWDQNYRKSKSNCTNNEKWMRDSINQTYVNYIILNFGFPFSKNLYSENAFNGLYYTIQHADIKTQSKYLSQIKMLVDSGILSQKKYAMTYDRVSVRTVGKQKYGEQRYLDTTDNYLKYFPFINIDSVQYYRRQIGLDSIGLNKKVKVIVK